MEQSTICGSGSLRPRGFAIPKFTGTLHAIDVLHRAALLAFLSCISLYYIIFPSNGRLLVVCTPSYSPSKGCILVTPCRIKYAKQENDGNNRLLHIAMKSGVSQIRVYRHMATSNDDQPGLTNACQWIHHAPRTPKAISQPLAGTEGKGGSLQSFLQQSSAMFDIGLKGILSSSMWN